MTQRPIVFLDIDGTLLPFGPGDRSQAVEDPRVWRAHSNPQLSRLRRAPSYDLVRLGGELVWPSAWGHDANNVVAPILALGRLPVVDFDEGDDDAVPGGVHWKRFGTRQGGRSSGSTTRSATPTSSGSRQPTPVRRSCTGSVRRQA